MHGRVLTLAMIATLAIAVSSAMAAAVGTSGPDAIAVAPADGEAYGYGDSDFIYLDTATTATLYGQDGDDTLTVSGLCGSGGPAYCAVTGENWRTHSFDAYGGSGDDMIYGGDLRDTAFGGSGDDQIFLGLTDSVIDQQFVLGGSGADFIRGDNLRAQGDDGDDTITADAGDNGIHGGSGDDVLTTYAGEDSLFGGSGRDLVYAGAGDDLIDVVDGQRDTAYCDVGTNDFAFADAADQLVGCENVIL